MNDIVDRLRRDALAWGGAVHTVSGPRVSDLENEAADEIEHMRTAIRSIDEAITAYAKSIGKSRESLAIQQHEPAWAAWKSLCDTLAASEPKADKE